MNEIPRNITTSVTTPTTQRVGREVRFYSVTDEEKPPVITIERRRNPSRRKPAQKKPSIERRVSSDRRRAKFSRKA